MQNPGKGSALFFFFSFRHSTERTSVFKTKFYALATILVHVLYYHIHLFCPSIHGHGQRETRVVPIYGKKSIYSKYLFNFLHRCFVATPHLAMGVERSHYENTPMQHTAIFHGCKNDNFQLIFFHFFHIFAQNIYCGYTLEPPH